MVNLVFTGDIRLSLLPCILRSATTCPWSCSEKLNPLVTSPVSFIPPRSKRFDGETILANICKFDTELRDYLDISKRNTQDEVIFFFQEVSTEISAFESIIPSVNLLYAFGWDIPVAACFCRDKPNPTFEKKKTICRVTSYGSLSLMSYPNSAPFPQIKAVVTKRATAPRRLWNVGKDICSRVQSDNLN